MSKTWTKELALYTLAAALLGAAFAMVATAVILWSSTFGGIGGTLAIAGAFTAQLSKNAEA